LKIKIFIVGGILIMTSEILRKKASQSPLLEKYSRRIAMLENARKVSGAREMKAYDKYYVAQLFENISKGNLYEAYTQTSNVGNFKRDAFNITSIAVQNTILPEIVSNQAMTTAAELLPILEFKYGTTKGAVTEGDTILDSTGMGKTDANYDSNRIEGQVIKSGTTTYLVAFTPIVPGTVNIDGITDEGVTPVDNVATLSDGTTVNYVTGEITFTSATVADKTLALTYSNEVVPNYLYPELDGHNRQQVGDVTLGINPVLIEAEEHKIRAIFALTAGYRINKEYGVNMPMVLESQIANEMNKEKERRVFKDIFAKANGGNAVVWSATPRPGVSDAEHAESLQIVINLAATEIYNRTGGNLIGNVVVGGANVAAYLQKCKGFTAYDAPANGGSYLAGKLGTMNVYVTPALDSNDFFIGAIGNDFWQAGYLVGDYMPITKTGAVTLADFTTQEGFVSIYGNKMVNDSLYIRGRITA
jgi:hypothetical protein